MPQPLPLLSAATLNQAALSTRTRVTLRGGVKVSMPRLADSLDQLETAIDESNVKVTIGERTLAVPGQYISLCQESGVPLDALHDAAAEIRALSIRAVQDKLRVLQEARDKSARQGISLNAVKRRAANGRDHDGIRAFDETAEHVAQRYSEYFRTEDPESELYEMLTEDAPTAISKAQAFEQAFRLLQGQCYTGPISDEPIPD